MLTKKIIGILLILLGVVSFFFANYVSNQIEEGNHKIHKTQKTVNQARRISKINPYSKVVGKIATRPVQKKINEGKEEVKEYATLAKWLHIGGVISCGVGLLFLIWGFIPKRKA